MSWLLKVYIAIPPGLPGSMSNVFTLHFFNHFHICFAVNIEYADRNDRVVENKHQIKWLKITLLHQSNNRASSSKSVVGCLQTNPSQIYTVVLFPIIGRSNSNFGAPLINGSDDAATIMFG